MTTHIEAEDELVLKRQPFVPSLAVFHCRWCLPETDLVRSFLPPEVAECSTFITLNCTARMEAEFAIKAFSEGFDGVLVLGCEIGECHFRTGNHQAVKRLALLKKMMSLCGVYPARLGFFKISPYDEDAIRKNVGLMVHGISSVGPFKYGKTWIRPRPR